MRYVIKWRGLHTKREGMESVCYNLDFARKRVARLNQEYSGLIEHWMEAVEDGDEKATHVSELSR